MFGSNRDLWVDLQVSVGGAIKNQDAIDVAGCTVLFALRFVFGMQVGDARRLDEFCPGRKNAFRFLLGILREPGRGPNQAQGNHIGHNQAAKMSHQFGFQI